MALLRAPIIASRIQPSVRQGGSPPAANSALTSANGSANTVCSNLIISRMIRSLVSILQPELLPDAVHPPLHLRVHHDVGGPGAREALTGPLGGGVDSHLGAEVREDGGVVELVDRAL